MHARKIWIINHYATNMYFNKGGRHYWFAKNLIDRGYDVTIFCASTRHNSSECINMRQNNYLIQSVEGIKFVFIKTHSYIKNSIKRIQNMVDFYKGLLSISIKYGDQNGKPDVIIASSVHPLTLVAGIKIAKKFGVPCICEVRDLWPLTLVEMDKITDRNFITKILYKFEHYIYRKADSIIFTMEGGRDYILDKGWDDIDLSKVYHINNGVDLYNFKEKQVSEAFEDIDFDNERIFKVIYTGSIRAFNNIETIVNVARLMNKQDFKDIKFIIYGDGDDRKYLEVICNEEHLQNIVFKGSVNKKYIPYILGKSNLNLLIYNDKVSVFKYGGSQNKLFEYFASGKPIISNIKMNYDLIEKYNCGFSIKNGDVEEIAANILKFYNMTKQEYDIYRENSIKAAQDFDFEKLTDKLEEVIRDTIRKVN
ncbi:glycosyltransferase family 4 protein [Sedimentibacter sp.]|nr:glycosyltransferase family 4 protein [Sedimentibacter sp.]